MGEFTKKINDNDFSGFTLYKKDLQYLSSNFKYMLIVKVYPEMKCSHLLSFLSLSF